MSAPRVLVVGPAWVGDMLLSQSLYKSLVARDPATHIAVLAPAWSRPLLARMPEVAEVVASPFGHGDLRLGERRSLGRSLRGRYDQALVLPRSLKAALAPWFARVPRRTGYRGEWRYGFINDMRPLDAAAMPRIVQRFVYLGMDAGAAPVRGETPPPALEIDPANRAACVARHGLDAAAPALALMPGAAFGRSKQWPPAHFAAAADRVAADGRQVWIFGSAADRDTGDAIAAAMRAPATNLCGRTSLEDVVDLLSLADGALSNDSGLMHVAAAVGCPVVAFYGATAPEYTPPMSSRARQLHRGLPCSPCWQGVCRYGHYRCMTEIKPAQAVAALAEIAPRAAAEKSEAEAE